MFKYPWTSYFIWQRNLKKAVKMDTLDSSSGILLPYYDHDTKIVFLAGKVRDSTS